MAYGNTTELDRIITDNGFTPNLEISHLGITIDRNLKLENIWTQKIQKCETLKNLLNALHPTFTNKISIIKTFILSQFCYIAAILPPTKQQVLAVENLILIFLYPNYPGHCTFSKAQTFTSCCKGGLGIPPPWMSFFLPSGQSSVSGHKNQTNLGQIH